MAFHPQYQPYQSTDNTEYHDIEYIQNLLRCVPSPLRRTLAEGPYASCCNPVKNLSGDSNGCHCVEIESSGYSSSAGNLIDHVSTSNVNASIGDVLNEKLNVEYESEVNVPVAQQKVRIVGGNRDLVELSASILSEAFGKAEAAKQLLKLDGLFNVVDDAKLFNKINRIVDELPIPTSQPMTNNQNEVIAVANEDIEAIIERPKRPRRTHFNYETDDADEIDASRPRHTYGKADLISFWESKSSTLPRDWSQIVRNFPDIVRR